ncbi:MAG: PPK2 family polyphosphate kinase [Ramlibacter sp.]
MSRFRHATPGGKFELARIDPGDRPCSTGKKAGDRQAVEALAVELDALQNKFWADRRYRLLVVLQGQDTSGKDGTLRHVFGRMSPLGVRTTGWKAPTENERAHDFLWRIHAAVPSDGEIVVFNRSHYEDVLVPVVGGQLEGKALQQRYAQINDFERLLCETGTVVLKFMLHISRDEQRKRLQERLDDPEKYWKFDPADLKAREHWDDYQRAYQEAIRATGTPWAPWIVVPSDSKTHRNLMIATVLQSTLKGLGLRFPPLPQALKGVKVA